MYACMYVRMHARMYEELNSMWWYIRQSQQGHSNIKGGILLIKGSGIIIIMLDFGL